MRFSIAASLLALTLACNSNTTPVIRRQSQVVLTVPPEVHIQGAINGWLWSAGSDNAIIEFYGPGPETTLTMTGDAILMARTRTVGSVEYLVVGVLDALENLTVYRLHDAGTDGLPDLSTMTTLFVITGPSYVTDMSIRDDGTAFLLDRRCQDVLRVLDTTSDDWPDSVGSTPFAMSDTFASLLDVRGLSAESSTVVHAMNIPVPSGLAGSLITSKVYEDTTADGVADSETDKTPAWSTPIPVGAPYDGQTSVFVAGVTGWTIEVWKLDANYALNTLIGSGTVGASAELEITLTGTISEGDWIAYKRTGTGTAGDEIVKIRVEDDVPQVVEAAPSVVFTGTSYATDVSGFNFVPGTTFKLEYNGALTTLTATIQDVRNATVTIPAIGSSDTGNHYLIALGPNADPETAAGLGHPIRVCKPPE